MKEITEASASVGLLLATALDILIVCHIQYTDLLHPNIHANFVRIIKEININPEGLDYY